MDREYFRWHTNCIYSINEKKLMGCRGMRVYAVFLREFERIVQVSVRRGLLQGAGKRENGETLCIDR